MSTITPRPEATPAAYGGLELDRTSCLPLEEITVRVTGRSSGGRSSSGQPAADTRCTIRVCDPDQRPYLEAEVELRGGRGELRFLAGGKLGTHYVYLMWSDSPRHARYSNFVLHAETRVETGDRDFDTLVPFSREAMLRGRREYDTPSGKMVGYISADTWHFDGIWLRDWIYTLPGYLHWERDMLCGLERFLENQGADGQIPDGIERDGRTWRVGLESDVEYIMVLGVWQSWQATGDDLWLRRVLPRLRKALRYITGDDRHWDRAHRLVKRQHSCDTWDYDIVGASDSGTSRHVIATCDQSGYLLAYEAMAAMERQLGEDARAERWAREAKAYGERASALLWDGTKFLHHAHLDDIDHGDFDESQQLAMGNTWAITRGLASPDQARSILDEYRRRHAATGDVYPWWSLQPGYPDHLHYWTDPFELQGGYANGGLMPWVGGELARGSFWFGRERYGVELTRQYADHLRRTGGAHVWYWPDGTPGFRTTNEVPYAGWGMAQWVAALVEGLAGVRDRSSVFRQVLLEPRWPAAGVREAAVAVRYAASGGYLAYRYSIDVEGKQIGLSVTGSGDTVDLRVLLPEGWSAPAISVDRKAVPTTVESSDQSMYATARFPIAGVKRVEVRCR